MADMTMAEGLEYFKEKENAMIATVESSSTASKAYKTDARFYFQGKLCIATSDIAQGDTIILSPTANFNCKLDVLGDDVTKQSEQISGFCLTNNPTLTFEQGSIRTVNGGVTDSTTRIRTAYYEYLGQYKRLDYHVPSGYKIYLFWYTGNTLSSYIGNSGAWLTGDGSIINKDATRYKINFAYSDDSTITPTDLPNGFSITLYDYTDTSLSILGKAADALTVGNIFVTALRYVNTLAATDDLNDCAVGIYRWASANNPINSPISNGVNNAGTLMCYGAASSPVQLCTDYLGNIYTRYKGSEWVAWSTHSVDSLTSIGKYYIDTNLNGATSTGNSTLTSSGTWGAKASNAAAVVLPVPDGIKKISFVGKSGCTIAFLDSYDTPVNGESADIDYRYPKRILLSNDGYTEYRLSDGIKYVYFLTANSTGTDLSPTNIKFYYEYVPEVLQELPVLYLDGDTTGMSKDTAVTLDYSIFGQTGTCSCKWQGSSSQRYIKKNYTITFDTGFDAWNKWATFVNALRTANGNASSIPTTSRWGTQKKYNMKANWIDPSMARNIVCARLWGQIVKSRVDASAVTDNRKDAPNYGAIDGFPIEIRLNNESLGLFTMNIPKGSWMFDMGEGQAEYVVSGEDNFSQACRWKATATVDGTDYSIEYAPDGVETSTIATSLNTAISAAINAGADWETELASYLDVDSVFDYFIFTCCINNHDALARNILYGTYDGTKWFMSAYDLDTTFGVDPYGTSWFAVVNDRNQFAQAANIHRLAYLMYTYSPAKLKTRYQALRSGVLSNANVWKELSNFIVDIPTRDYEIDRNIWLSVPGTSTANMAQYMDYYKMHTDYLDAEIAALS